MEPEEKKEELNLTHILQTTPDLLNIDAFLRQILTKISFQEFITEIINYPEVYDAISLKQDFWKEYLLQKYPNHTISNENINWFFENFSTTKYYLNYRRSDHSLVLFLPNFISSSDLRIIPQNLLPIDNVKDVIIRQFSIYFLFNDGTLFKYNRNNRILIMKNVNKIIFQYKSLTISDVGILIILTNDGEIWLYETAKDKNIPTDLYKQNLHFKVKDIKIIKDTDSYFIIVNFDNESMIYKVIKYEVKKIAYIFSDILLFEVWYVHIYPIDFVVFYHVGDGTLGFTIIDPTQKPGNLYSFLTNLKIVDLNLFRIHYQYLQIIDSNHNYYWVKIDGIPSILTHLENDMVKFEQELQTQIYPQLTEQGLKLSKVNTPNEIGIRDIVVSNTNNLGRNFTVLYIINKKDNVYKFPEDKLFREIAYPFREIEYPFKLFQQKYEKYHIPNLNRIFITPEINQNLGVILQVMESEYVLVHKFHFVVATLNKEVKEEAWSKDKKSVIYSVTNSKYKFRVNLE